MNKEKNVSEMMKVIFSFLSLSFYYIASIFLIRYCLYSEYKFIAVYAVPAFFIVPAVIICMVIFKTGSDLVFKRDTAVFRAKLIVIISFVFALLLTLIGDMYVRQKKEVRNDKISVHGYREISEIIGETLRLGRADAVWDVSELMNYISAIPGVKFVEIADRAGKVLIRKNGNISKMPHVYDGDFLKNQIRLLDSTGVRIITDTGGTTFVDLEYKVRSIVNESVYYMDIGFQPVGQVPSLDAESDSIDDLFSGYFYIFSAVILYLFGVLAVYFISKEFAYMAELLSGGMLRVGKGDLDYYIHKNEHQDLSGAISAFNKMVVDLKKNRRSIAEREKKNAWEEISKRISHELKNPLTPIRLSAERMLLKYGKEGFEDTLRKSVQIILTQIDSMDKKIDSFSEFSVLPAMSMFLGTISDPLLKSYEKVKSMNPNVNIIFNRNHRDLQILRDAYSLEFVFANMIEICIKEMVVNDNVILETANYREDDTDYIVVCTKNESCLLKYEQMRSEYYGESISSYKYILSAIKKIIEDHRGSFYISNDTNGVILSVFFPLDQMVEKVSDEKEDKA